jgi:hypothetical protein
LLHPCEKKLSDFSLSSRLHNVFELAAVVSRIRHCASATAIHGSQALLDAFVDAHVSACRTQDALRELEDAIRRHRELEGVSLNHDDLAAVHDFRQEMTLLIEALSLVCSAARASRVPLFTASKLLDHISDIEKSIG